jgi:hypothetical protein
MLKPRRQEEECGHKEKHMGGKREGENTNK